MIVYDNMVMITLFRINSSRLFSLECCQSVTNLTVAIMNSTLCIVISCEHEKTNYYCVNFILEEDLKLDKTLKIHFRFSRILECLAHFLQEPNDRGIRDKNYCTNLFMNRSLFCKKHSSSVLICFGQRIFFNIQ